MFAPRRMAQTAIVLLFSGVHSAACIAVGRFIAHQHENPDPQMEARLYELENFLLQPLGASLIDLAPSSSLLHSPSSSLLLEDSTATLCLLAHQEHVAAGLGRAAFGFERDGERVGCGRGGFGKLLNHEEEIARGLFKVEDPG